MQTDLFNKNMFSQDRAPDGTVVPYLNKKDTDQPSHSQTLISNFVNHG